MKAKITKDGMLIIEAETEIETYAMRHWLKENPIEIPMNLMIIASNPLNIKQEIKRETTNPNIPDRSLQ